MDKKKWMLLLGGAFIVLLAVMLYSGNQKNEEKVSNRDKTDESWKGTKTDGSDFFSNFPDAPAPSEEEREVSRLWPHALEPQDPKLKEKVKEEWQDFARKYPDNLYIPHEIRGGSLTEDEENEIIETLDSFTSVDSQFASFAAANKYATPGSEVPPGVDEKNANPKEMAKYFDYKIRELESRIQLIEYTMQNSRLSSVDESTAKKDISNWRKELANLKAIQGEVPKS